MKILVNALSGIGDALMFTPALRILRNSYPDAQIDAMVMYKGVSDFYEHLNSIDRVHYFDFLNSNPLAALKFVLGLRGKYDASINVYPSNRKEYNIINFLLGAKRRLGVRYLRSDIKNLGFLNNVVIYENDDLHNVEENVKLVEKLIPQQITGISDLEFPLSDTDKKFADNYISNLGIETDKKIIGIHAGCSVLKNHINRRWSPGKFAELIKKLSEGKNIAVLLFGGGDEIELNETIKNKAATSNVTIVKTESLIQSAAIMSKCDLFITNDSGLMHIAAALKLNIVPIIGPTSLKYIHPWHTEYTAATLNLDCSPCFIYSPKPLQCKRDDVKFKCLKELSVQQVYNITRNYL